MKSFHSDPAVKEKYVSRVMAHAKADQLVQGTGWEDGRGCAVGCTLEAYDHSRYPIELGLPEWLAHLEDRIFECLPEAQAMKWPMRLLKAIPVGVDVDCVQWQLAIWRHTKQLVSLDSNSEPYALEVRAAIKQVIVYCEGMLAKTFTSESAARSAWSAARSAWSAAESAARSAAWSAARSAARSAAWSAARSAAESAAWSSAESAARSAAWSAAYIEEADMLIKLLKGVKP